MSEYRKYIEDDIRTTATPMFREKLAELGEVYRKADAHDNAIDKYRLLLSIFDEMSPGEMMDKLAEMDRKAKAFDEMKVKYAENLNYVKGLTEDGLEGSVFHEMVLGGFSDKLF